MASFLLLLLLLLGLATEVIEAGYGAVSCNKFLNLLLLDMAFKAGDIDQVTIALIHMTLLLDELLLFLSLAQALALLPLHQGFAELKSALTLQSGLGEWVRLRFCLLSLT